jgi:hypothetical protein
LQGVVEVWVGANFLFGHERAGTFRCDDDERCVTPYRSADCVSAGAPVPDGGSSP